MEIVTSKVYEVAIDSSDLEFLYLTIDQQRYRIRWTSCSDRLSLATPEERACFDVSPSGYGIHWPLIDEDLAVGPLVRQAEPLVS